MAHGKYLHTYIFIYTKTTHSSIYVLTVNCPHDLLQVPPDGGEADCPVARGGGDHHRAVTRAQVTCSGYDIDIILI